MLGLHYATKVYVVTLLSFLVLRANIFLLRRDFGPNELGLYSIAAQLSDVLSIVPQAISIVIFPRLVKEASTRWEATVRAALMTAGLMVVACSFTAVVAGPAIRILYGAEFLPAASVLRIMLPGIACLGIASVLSQYLGAEGMPRIMVAIWFGAALLVGAVSLALVPTHAGAGAAAALSITYAVLLVAMIAASRLVTIARDAGWSRRARRSSSTSRRYRRQASNALACPGRPLRFAPCSCSAPSFDRPRTCRLSTHAGVPRPCGAVGSGACQLPDRRRAQGRRGTCDSRTPARGALVARSDPSRGTPPRARSRPSSPQRHLPPIRPRSRSSISICERPRCHG